MALLLRDIMSRAYEDGFVEAFFLPFSISMEMCGVVVLHS